MICRSFFLINILRKINNDHVVRYLDRINEKDKCVINIIMEYCPGGDLQHLISKTKISGEYIREEQIWLSLGELALALKDCHCAPEKILHRDIKPGNIFIDEEGHVKLGDFGLAKKIDTDYTKTILGTPYYMCPEINKSARYNEECDIWALGCVIYEMAALEPPFRGNSQEMLKRNILYSPVTRFSRKYYSESLWKIVSWMLEKDPKKRPSFDQIVEELKTDEDFITEFVEQEDFFDYVEYIENSKTDFDSTKNIIQIDKFVHRQTDTFKKNSISQLKTSQKEKKDASERARNFKIGVFCESFECSLIFFLSCFNFSLSSKFFSSICVDFSLS